LRPKWLEQILYFRSGPRQISVGPLATSKSGRIKQRAIAASSKKDIDSLRQDLPQPIRKLISGEQAMTINQHRIPEGALTP
jgi:hypothetical protein